MREAEKMANERGGKFWGSDDVGAASRGVAPWRRGVAIGRHFTLNFIQAIHLKALTTAQEHQLISHLNRLSDRGIPATVQITENIVSELVQRPVGHNWVYRFCQRYDHELKSVYLRAIDNSRQVADNSEHFEHYFTTVGNLLDLIMILDCLYLNFIMLPG
jgi:hypothetical protein